MRTLLRTVGALAACAALGCVGPEDVPSNVFDLRVLGVQLSPPEIMAPACIRDVSDPQAQAALAAYAQPVVYTALLQDPAGGGRPIEYKLWACASTRDRDCSDKGERFLLAPDPQDPSDPRTAGPGELTVSIQPALLGVDLGTGDFSNSLLLNVLENDPYKGLGGIRVPTVLNVEAGEEEIFAQKLMVYSCNFFPERPGYDGPTMTPNENPVLPGVLLGDDPWEEGEVPLLEGDGPFVMVPQDFADRQEHYVVPSFELQPVALVERWKIAWHADLGRFSPNETGGASYGGEDVRHRVEWLPPPDAREQDVNFWFVVRDGRGGVSWLKRTAHYKP